MTWGALKSLSIYPNRDRSSKDHKEGILSVCCNKWLLKLYLPFLNSVNPECKKKKRIKRKSDIRRLTTISLGRS